VRPGAFLLQKLVQDFVDLLRRQRWHLCLVPLPNGVGIVRIQVAKTGGDVGEDFC
jgi:hypothetical protein